MFLISYLVVLAVLLLCLMVSAVFGVGSFDSFAVLIFLLFWCFSGFVFSKGFLLLGVFLCFAGVYLFGVMVGLADACVVWLDCVVCELV